MVIKKRGKRKKKVSKRMRMESRMKNKY